MSEQDSCWDEVLSAMPESTLAVRKIAFRLLQSGRPTSIDAVATECDLPHDTVRDAVNLVASVGMAELDEETIIGIDGLTTRRTHHQLVLNGVHLWTWCAYDVVGIAAALRADAVGRTECGACGQLINLVVRGGEPEHSTGLG